MGVLKNKKHEIFAQEIASGAPQIVAYATAGFEDTPSAIANASRLRNTPAVAARIDELQTGEMTFSDRVAQKVEWLRSKIYPVMDFDPLDLFVQSDPKNPSALDLKPLAKIPPRTRKMIVKMKRDPETKEVTEITFSDKLAAANMLLRSLPGGDVQRVEHTGAGGGPLTITVAHLVDRLYAPAMIENAGPRKLEILNRLERDLRLLAADEDGDVIDAQAEEVPS